MKCQECHDYIDAYIDNELDISATILVKQRSGSRFVIPWLSVPLAWAATIAVVLGLVFLNQGGMFDR